VSVRVVLDTNVLVSGIGWSGPPAAIVDAALAGRVTPLTTSALLSELTRALGYPKLKSIAPAAETLVQLLRAAFIVVDVERRIAVCADETDNRVLEAAVNGGADYIVTGDKHLLELDPFEGIRIVRPAEFLSTALR
jgi:uncharacterized protein